VVGPAAGIFVCLLEAFGRIKFHHFERFPIWGEKLIIVSNHPSLLEPVVLPLMGFPWMNFPWVFSPVWYRFKFSLSWIKELQREFTRQKKLIPANVPDKGNFYDPPYMKVFQGINVPVDRNGGARGRNGHHHRSQGDSGQRRQDSHLPRGAPAPSRRCSGRATSSPTANGWEAQGRGGLAGS